MKKTDRVPKATHGRLPIYLDYLSSIKDRAENISATALAKELGLGEVQVRKDLNAVSGEGRPKTGYVIGDLICKLEEYLGIHNQRKAVLVGAGKLGKALLDYDGFSEYGIDVTAAFDISLTSEVITENNKPIYPMERFPSYCSENGVDIGIITVPKGAAQNVCNLMTENGILYIWSFAQKILTVPENVRVKQENLALSIAHLIK